MGRLRLWIWKILKMIELLLIGIGTGNPDHMTLAAVKALNTADLILIPNKGPHKSDLSDLRHHICKDVVTNSEVQIHTFDLPVRDESISDYKVRVDNWHDEIADTWAQVIISKLGANGRVAFLVWGDPSLYDSTLRIAERVGKIMPITVSVFPGITAIQALTASHGIPINNIGAPFMVTTGRKLREEGWPSDVDTMVIMLDGECSFKYLGDDNITIFWGAYLGMENEIIISGLLPKVTEEILATRAKARADHGWIMDIYILQKST